MLLDRPSDASRNVPEDAAGKEIPALLNQIDQDRIFRRRIENGAEVEIGVDSGFDIALAFGFDHSLEQRAHFVDRLIGDLCCSQPRRLRLKQRANTVDAS